MSGFMLELLLSKEKLFTRTEDKVFFATDALQSPVGEFHAGAYDLSFSTLDLPGNRGIRKSSTCPNRPTLTFLPM